ncbi:ABC transporter ATP-binding protein [Zhengella mangrovi]|uniref:ABC transporter ATP-binding protein n=1 Tax=Zhengella mangrovi TaxID=1982044 RepID=A0A2G1QQS3_9HYPH|nr:ABC transporter ATP-binding protein [Zhengella mangrovi]
MLSIEGLTIDFSALRALDRVSLTVSPGERVALLGHNGAGKSTLFKTVLGFLSPAEGSVSVDGAAPGSDAARRSVSYLPEQVAFPKALTGREVMDYFSRLKGAGRADIARLLDLVGLGEAASRAVGSYSKGMRQRLGLAQALIGKPRLLLLDEPTSGLDPVSRLEFYDIIARIAGEGAGVLLSSHALTEVEARTDRVAILSKGRLVADGTLARLASQAQLSMSVRIEARAGRADAVQAHLGGRRVNGKSVIIECDPSGKIALFGRIGGLSEDIADIDVSMPTLDDIYTHYSSLARTEGAS